MKKIILLQEIESSLSSQKTVFSRNNIVIQKAASNDEVLDLHRADPASLIVIRADGPGMSGEELCTVLRQDKAMRNVSVIVVCPDTGAGRSAAARCRANEVLTLPLQPALLIEKAQQLLQIPLRKSYRVLLSVTIEGKGAGSTFLCKSENISATGLLIETDRHLEAGDSVSCSFFLGRTQVAASGEIVRTIVPPLDSNLHRYGVRFTNISEAAKKAISDFSDQTRTIPGS